MGRHDGKVAIVTGASSGIGRAIALRLASEGAKVVVGARRTEQLEEVVREIRAAGGEARAMSCDVTMEQDIRALVAAAVEAYGALHIAVNNAGVTGGFRSIADFDREHYDLVFNTNVRAVFLGLKHEIPALNATGPGGVIINTSSTISTFAMTKNANTSIYAASKAAVDMITKIAAIENPKLRINSVNPGVIDTEMSRIIPPKVINDLQLVGRPGRPEEVGGLVSYLASDEASFITGTTHVIDGGCALTGM